MKIPNPPDSPFEREDDSHGFRTTFGAEEIVDKRTGQSNHQYYKPEMVLNPKGCKHRFKLIDQPRRELMCELCGWGVTAHVSSLVENDKGLFVKLPQGMYQIYL